MASNVMANYSPIATLTKHGLKVILTPEMKEELSKRKIVYEWTNSPLDPVTVPIGLCFVDGFEFKNKLKIPTDERFRIVKPLVKTYNLNKNQKIVMRYISNKIREFQQKRYPVYLCIQAECGFGKTLLGINIIYKMPNNKTFIVVHSKTAASQFAERINTFLPGLDVYVSENGATAFLNEAATRESPDILIIPSPHLLNDDFISYLRKNYTLGLIDEAHLNNFNQDSGLKKFYMNNIFPTIISMTATPRDANTYFLGHHIACNELIKIDHGFNKYAIAVITDQRVPNYHQCEDYQKYLSYKKPTGRYVGKLLCLSRDPNRRKMITAHIKLDYTRRLNARILLLCEFIKEVEYYTNVFKACGYNVIAKSGDDEVVESVNDFIKDKERYIVIGTVSKLGTGFDLPSCNTVFLSLIYNTPTDVQQYAGRCTRIYTPDNHVDRKFYYFLISPTDDIQIHDTYKNMQKALKQAGWELREMYCAPKSE